MDVDTSDVLDSKEGSLAQIITTIVSETSTSHPFLIPSFIVHSCISIQEEYIIIPCTKEKRVPSVLYFWEEHRYPCSMKHMIDEYIIEFVGPLICCASKL